MIFRLTGLHDLTLIMINNTIEYFFTIFIYNLGKSEIKPFKS